MVGIKKNIENAASLHENSDIILSVIEMYGGLSKTIEYLYMSYEHREIFKEIYSLEHNECNCAMSLVMQNLTKKQLNLNLNNLHSTISKPHCGNTFPRRIIQTSTSSVSKVDENALLKEVSASDIAMGRPRSTRLVTPK
jgi:hypothetical protein